MLYPEDDRSRRFFEDIRAHGFDTLPDRNGQLERLRERRYPYSLDPQRLTNDVSWRICSTSAFT
jgi:hypothetical protein